MIVSGLRRPWGAAVAVLGLVGSLLAVGAGPAGGTAGVSDNEAIYSACVGPALESAGLLDVVGSFAEDAVNCLAHYGVTRGRTATTYGPGLPVSRWQMALFLKRAAGPAGVVLPANPAGGFTDIGGVFEEGRTAINQMAALDVMPGVTSTTFRPDVWVSRAQMALMLDSFLVAAEKGSGLGLGALGADADELSEVVPDDDIFDDLDNVTLGEYSAIQRVFELGVARGTAYDRFSPEGLVTRAQMAVFIMRMLAHTVARPAGLTLQAAKSSVAEGESVDLVVSVRNSGLMAVPDAVVDVFSSSAPDDAFESDGRCSDNGVVAVGGSGVCVIALGDETTDASGDLKLTSDGLESSTTIWAWTGAVGDRYDADDSVWSSLRIMVPLPADKLSPDPDGIYTGDPLQLIAHAEFTCAYTLPGSAGDRFDVWLCNTPSVRYYSENPDIRHNPSNYADKFHSQVSPWFRWLSGGLYKPSFRAGGVVTVGLSLDYYQSCDSEVFDRYPGGGSDTDGVVIVVGSLSRHGGRLGQGGCGLFSQRAFPDNQRAVLVNGSAFTDPTVLAHEMGHALCWPHSFSGETEYRGEVWEYDNPMDIMGWSSSVQSAPVPGLGTHAVNRYAAGWIPPSQVAVHTPGTTARYTLEPIGGDGLQMLIVPYEDNRLDYYRALGVRVRGEGDLWWADEDIVEEGVEISDIDQTVYGCDLPDRGYCYGLDRRTQPIFDGDDGYEARDAAHVMQPDDAWYWQDGDAIEVISRDGDSFVVEVRPYTE